MRIVRVWLSAVVACAALAAPVAVAPWPAVAQGGLDPNRDCQVLTTCQYGRGGAWRGCLSSYSCRVCRLVPSRCDLGPGSRVCYRMQCTWG